MSKIVLSEEREELIRESFGDQEMHFSYSHDLDDFNYLVENFTQEKSDYVDSELGENLKINKLVVMDDVSGLADRSSKFSDFLTASREYGFSCLYVFHTIYPGRKNWEMIMSQTHIFNFFPGSIHNSRILKTLSFFVSQQKNTYLPNKKIWLNKLYFQISNYQEKKCLTIDTRDVNESGPGKFRTSANNEEEQTCYFNRNKNNTDFTSFFAQHTQAEPIQFFIVKQIFDFDFVNKSFDVSAKKSVSDRELKRQLQQDSLESFNNGRSTNKRRSDSDRLYDNSTESNDVRQQQCDGLLRRDQAGTRKKPRFLSTAE